MEMVINLYESPRKEINEKKYNIIMSVSIIYNGRLGNNLFQYVSAYFFAKKFNLKLIKPGSLSIMTPR